MISIKSKKLKKLDVRTDRLPNNQYLNTIKNTIMIEPYGSTGTND